MGTYLCSACWNNGSVFADLMFMVYLVFIGHSYHEEPESPGCYVRWLPECSASAGGYHPSAPRAGQLASAFLGHHPSALKENHYPRPELHLKRASVSLPAQQWVMVLTPGTCYLRFLSHVPYSLGEHHGTYKSGQAPFWFCLRSVCVRVWKSLAPSPAFFFVPLMRCR